MSLPLAIIIGAFVCIALLERVRPARPPQRRRWPFNLALGLCNGAALRLAALIGPIGAAKLALTHHIGLFNAFASGQWFIIPLVVLLMDLAIYWQHRAMHRFAPLWHVHKLHHADRDFDVTTGVRFHPGEAALSFVYKSALVLLLGAPLEAVVVFEVWLTVGSLIEHGNIVLPDWLDRALRRFWVTPAMHRIHHSSQGLDHNHNYGFALSLWDHLFGSYLDTPTGAGIGLPQQ